ncbi:YkgJ family cysteine cluster protein [Edaphobacter flagellatus]|uniref:YkgJ family cysteine cluster protein n=1 Tax=Edaphobacter flagellatus TaxID=1933044 RepID=UPI0021B362BF|nr:YkgJ family cysteine cluster protein [Edaphobacter flagellatus]
MSTDDRLVHIVDAALVSAVERGGTHLACRPGCTQCCHGVFPISQQDASRLRNALSALEHGDTSAAQRIRARVVDSLARIAPLFPGDLVTGILNDAYEEAALFADEESIGDNEPCPVLDPVTGTCDLYAARPIVCRTFGPPMRTAEGDLATCELCFITATTEEIAAAELDPTLPAQETASNAAFDVAHHLHGETIVAFALRNA